MNYIDFHSDDYGISLNNSKRILELVRDGHLDSISIIPNMGQYEECIKLLKAEWDSLPIKPLISVHINLVGGVPLTPEFTPYESWGQVLIKSHIYGPKRADMRKRIKAEVSAQISRVYKDTCDLPGINGRLRIDGHIHIQMIPLVFDSVITAIKELGLHDNLDYYRVSDEPLLPFLSTPSMWGTFPLISIVKNLILKFLSFRAKRILNMLGVEYCALWGLIMSGKMDEDRIKIMLPKMINYANKHNTTVELFCHPGIVLPEEASSEYGADDKIAFISENRNIEYNAMQNCCNRL